MTEPAVRVVLADDHPVIRDGLAALLTATEGIEVLATAESGAEAVDAAVTARPDVLVVDLHMPGGIDGVEATRRVRAGAPEVGVLVLTMLDDDTSVRAALDAGAAGYVLKGDSRQQIVRAIHAVAAGATFLGAGVTPGPFGADAFAELTARERQILDMLATGVPTATIAARLGVAAKTVTNNLSTIFAKLGVTGRTEAALLARDHGLGRRG
ncbi:DNA-binding response regulator [Actinomycetospora sp. NBRC 106375]|uniref:response regulator transcription factor n=1 Tax=Actinomycetospora sp. NBRC 106375 TaxID=3032207 RepID=UPI0024A0F4E2|nr:response regulator transcription factor [Actinomycetospora sp. NBRC 106375]GLZ47954.1 DNA-binding response regulator [Actinomycetospora sp. NBRC 106375]